MSGAVVLSHGFDQTKEWTTPFEAAAHGCGLATLSIDLPGMGESGVAGTRLRSYELLGPITQAAASWLLDRAMFPVFIFGVSGGGLAALSAAGFDSRIAASVGVGSPSSLARILRRLPAQQRQHQLNWSGSGSLGELRALIDGFELAPVLSRVAVPCLIVHGAREDDHMCTHALETRCT